MDAKFEKAVNWRKVDPNLAATISDADDPDLRVIILLSVSCKPGVGPVRWMRKLGVRGQLEVDGGVLSAETTLDGVRRLSQRPYVTYMSESRKLSPARRS